MNGRDIGTSSPPGRIPLLVWLAGWTILSAPLFAQPPPPRFEQRIGEQLPLQANVTDESGHPEPLGACFGQRPVLLMFGYFNCPQLCSVIERSAVDTLRDLKPSVGQNFDFVYLSIDPADTPAEARRKHDEAVAEYGRPSSGAGWHFLTGREADTRAIAEAAGFNYRYDPRTRQYQHPSGYVVATPAGVVSRYFLGVDLPAKQAAEAFRRAAAGQTGRPVFDLLLECFRGDGFSGRYGPAIWCVLEIAVALTILVVFGGIGYLLWLERKGGKKGESLPAIALLPGWPAAASTEAVHVDHIALGFLAVALLLVAGLGLLNLYFIIRYRRGSPAPRPPLRVSSDSIEAAWIIATTVVFLIFFAVGARAFIRIERPPADAMEIHVVGRQWMWDIRQQNGRREFDELHVPVGVPVRLILTSEDVIHSFYVPAFRLKQDVVPGKTVSLWFQATKAGSYPLYCSEFCGSMHDRMTGTVVVQRPDDYARWLGNGGAASSDVSEGRMLFVQYGCAGCHAAGATVRAPPLSGLYGARVPLAAGGFARVDEQYLRDCILLPQKSPPAGYPPIMPSFQGVIPEGKLITLIAYLEQLGSDAGAPEPPREEAP